MMDINVYNIHSGAVVFFFPFFHEGERERKYLEIAKKYRTSESVIFFTGPSNDETLLTEFGKCGTVYQLCPDRNPQTIKGKQERIEKVIQTINALDKALLIGSSNSIDYSESIVTGIKKEIPCWDFLPDTFSMLNLSNVEYIEKRWLWDQETFDNVCFTYKYHNVEQEYLSRVQILIF